MYLEFIERQPPIWHAMNGIGASGISQRATTMINAKSEKEPRPFPAFELADGEIMHYTERGRRHSGDHGEQPMSSFRRTCDCRRYLLKLNTPRRFHFEGSFKARFFQTVGVRPFLVSQLCTD